MMMTMIIMTFPNVSASNKYLFILTNSVAWFHERAIPTEWPPLVGEDSAKFADRVCNVVSVADLYGSILGFLDRSRLFSYK
jgi:hypothetical protein